MWKLFLDDIRYPVDDDCKIARNMDEAIKLIALHGSPSFIYFDHDLGENERTGFDFAKWLVEKDLDLNGIFLSKSFNFYIHSANPIGSANISGLLNNYLNVKNSVNTNNNISISYKNE